MFSGLLQQPLYCFLITVQALQGSSSWSHMLFLVCKRDSSMSCTRLPVIWDLSTSHYHILPSPAFTPHSSHSELLVFLDAHLLFSSVCLYSGSPSAQNTLPLMPLPYSVKFSLVIFVSKKASKLPFLLCLCQVLLWILCVSPLLNLLLKNICHFVCLFLPRFFVFLFFLNSISGSLKKKTMCYTPFSLQHLVQSLTQSINKCLQGKE